MKIPTAVQLEVLGVIRDFTRERGYPPTVREICAAIGVASPSTVHAHLAALQRKGCIARDPTKPRAITVTPSDDDEDATAEVNRLTMELEEHREICGELTAEIDRLTLLVEAHVRVAVMCRRGWVLLMNHNGHDAVWVKGSQEAPAGPYDRRAVLAVADAHVDVTAGRWPLPTEVPSEAS